MHHEESTERGEEMRGICETFCMAAASFGTGLLLALLFPIRLVLIIAAALLTGVCVMVLRR